MPPEQREQQIRERLAKIEPSIRAYASSFNGRVATAMIMSDDLLLLLSTLDSERAKCAAKDAALGRYAHSNTITLEQHPTDTIFNNAPWVARAALSPDCGSTFVQRIREECAKVAENTAISVNMADRPDDAANDHSVRIAASIRNMKGVAP
jgi:hypothetical protein